jgi:hypothetical protein
MKRQIRSICLALTFLPLVIFGQQFENPGFENWENAGTVKDEPVDWSTIKTSDDPGISSVAPVTFSRCDTAHTGNYSLRLYNVSVFGIVATGAITNGRFHAEFNLDSSYSYTDPSDPKWNTPFSWRPDSLVGWFKFYPKEQDRAQFKAITHVGECKLPANGTMQNWISMAVFVTEPGVTYDNWTRFSVPFDYYDDGTPEYLFCTMNSGDSTTAITGSILLIDDLKLVYPPSGISEHRIAEPFLTEAKDKLIINLKNDDEYINQWFYLVDISGKTLLTIQLDNNQVELPKNLRSGVYVAVLKGKSQQFSQKIIIP